MRATTETESMSTQIVNDGDRVRVTIEGTGRMLGDSRTALRVEYDNDQVVAIVPTDAVGVSVERLSASYQWSDGDVVQEQSGAMTTTWERNATTRGSAFPWQSADVAGAHKLGDAAVSTMVGAGARVLRYQAGDEA